MARTGRRVGAPDTRGRIIDAARERFAADGYAGATIRSIAAEADVDPALVHHYFGPKTQLFAEVMALPVDVATVVASVLDGPVEDLGERMIRMFLSVWDSADARTQLQGLLRAAVSEDHAADVFHDFLFEAILTPITRTIARPGAELRATLVGSQLVGAAIARYVIAIEPLASAPAETLVAVYAPTLQRYLTGDLDG